jgi:hypothetical protein
MGRMYDAVEAIDEIIARKGLDVFHTKGDISMRTGFLLSFVDPSDPDDEDKLRELQDAVMAVLGERLSV